MISTIKSKFNGTLLISILILFLFWPIPIVVLYQISIEDTGINVVYSILSIEGFWLAIVGGFFLLLWLDSKKIFHK